MRRPDQPHIARQNADELIEIGFTINRRTVTRHLNRLGLGHRRYLDPCGENNRKPGKIIQQQAADA